MAAVIYVAPDSQQAAWKKSDDLPGAVRSELEKYCLCGVEWDKKEDGTIKCSANDACEGQDCIFWTLTYTQLQTAGIVQDIEVSKFGQVKPEGGMVTKFAEEKTYKTLKLGKDGDVVKSAKSTVIFCSCGTGQEIRELQAKHAWVQPPADDPPK